MQMTIQKEFLTLAAAHCCPVLTIIIFLNLKHFAKKCQKTHFFTEIFARLFRKNLLSLKIIRRTLSLNYILIAHILDFIPSYRFIIHGFDIEM